MCHLSGPFRADARFQGPSRALPRLDQEMGSWREVEGYFAVIKQE